MKMFLGDTENAGPFWKGKEEILMKWILKNVPINIYNISMNM